MNIQIALVIEVVRVGLENKYDIELHKELVRKQLIKQVCNWIIFLFIWKNIITWSVCPKRKYRKSNKRYSKGKIWKYVKKPSNRTWKLKNYMP